MNTDFIKFIILGRLEINELRKLTILVNIISLNLIRFDKSIVITTEKVNHMISIYLLNIIML